MDEDDATLIMWSLLEVHAKLDRVIDCSRMAKKKRKTELTAEFWERDAAMRRALERRIAELESRKPPDQRLVPPR